MFAKSRAEYMSIKLRSQPFISIGVVPVSYNGYNNLLYFCVVEKVILPDNASTTSLSNAIHSITGYFYS